MRQIIIKDVDKEILFAVKKKLENFFRANKIGCLVKVLDVNQGIIEFRGDLNDIQIAQINSILEQAKKEYNFEFGYCMAA